MKKEASLSLILAQRIIEMFDEAGANKTERYCAVNLVTAMIPASVGEDGEGATAAESQS
jgi:hypothetical protein